MKAQFFGPHAAFPPPFQWVYLIVQMVYNIKKKEASKREERNVMDKKKKVPASPGSINPGEDIP